MLKLGIVGKHNYVSEFVNDLSTSDFFVFAGIYDPVFQINGKGNVGVGVKFFSDFEIFINTVDAVVFYSCEKINFHLLQNIIKQSVPVFIKGTSNFDIEQHKILLKLEEESGQVIQVYHPYNLHNIVNRKGGYFQLPYHISVDCSLNDISLIKDNLRNSINAVLLLANSDIKKSSEHTFSVFNNIPDSYNVNIDFRNGSIGKIDVRATDDISEHIIKVYTHDEAYFFDILKGVCIKKVKNNDEILSETIDTNMMFSLNSQLKEFYLNILYNNSIKSGFSYSLKSQQIMNKINEKVKTVFSLI